MIPSGYKESLLNFGISEEKADNIVQMCEDLEEWQKDNNNHFDIESSVKSEIEAALESDDIEVITAKYPAFASMINIAVTPKKAKNTLYIRTSQPFKAFQFK